MFAPWSFRNPAAMAGAYVRRMEQERLEGRPGPPEEDLTGFHVEAVDGRVGTVDEATYEVGSAYLVVDTGPWIFGRQLLLPAGTVECIDCDTRTVYVDRTKAQLRDAPAYDPAAGDRAAHRERVADYFADTYRTTPPRDPT